MNEQIEKLAEENIGALTFLKGCLFFTQVQQIFDFLEKHQIKGEELYILWNDYYKRDTYSFGETLKFQSSLGSKKWDRKTHIKLLKEKHFLPFHCDFETEETTDRIIPPNPI